MAVSLICISFLTLLLVCWQGDGRETGLRSAYLKAAIVHGVAIALSTEILSAGKLLMAPAVTLVWTLLALIHSVLLARLVSLGRLSLSLKQLGWRWQPLGRPDQLLLAGISTIVLICLATALIATPNNWDAMSYHLPRVMHWIQNRSLAHYPTHNLRQISFPGGANYIVLHLQLLSGGDRFANTVQWAAFVGCIAGTSLITRALGNPALQLTTAALCASIAMAVMQATTAQTDLVVAFWLVCCAYEILGSARYGPRELLWIAAAWGLAVLTKPTAFIFGAPLLALLALRLARNGNPSWSLKRLWRGIGLTVGVALLGLGLSLPSYGRNLATFGSWLGIDTDTRNTVLGPVQLLANLVRNIAVLIPFPPVFHLSQAFLQGVGIDPNDSGSTFVSSPFEISIVNWHTLLIPDEDTVASPIHAGLMLLSFGVLLGAACWPQRRSPLWQLAAANLLGFLLFCLLLRWQVWHNRLLLPCLILSTPLISQWVGQWPKLLSRGLVASLTLVALVYSLLPIHHPLISLPESWTNATQSPSILRLSREEMLFSSYIKHLREPYRQLADTLVRDRCPALGLDISADDWEYPFWRLLQARTQEPFQIRHEAVQNLSRSLPPEFPDTQLCGIFQKRQLELRYFNRNLPTTP